MDHLSTVVVLLTLKIDALNTATLAPHVCTCTYLLPLNRESYYLLQLKTILELEFSRELICGLTVSFTHNNRVLKVLNDGSSFSWAISY